MKKATSEDIHLLNGSEPAIFNGIDFSVAGVSSADYPNHQFYNCVFSDDADKNRVFSDLENKIQDTDHNKNSNDARMNLEHHLLSDDKEIREYALEIYRMKRKEAKENAFFGFFGIVFMVVLIRFLFFPF